MDDLTIGHGKLIYKHLGFLAGEYQMKCCFQELPDTEKVENPTYIYSFYNDSGCFSVKEAAQTDEWDCYVSKQYDDNPRLLLNIKIDQHSYITRNVYSARTFLKLTAEAIRKHIEESGSFWGIRVV